MLNRSRTNTSAFPATGRVAAIAAAILVAMICSLPLASAHDGDVSGEETASVSLTIKERFEYLDRQSTNACGLQPETVSRLEVERLQGACCGPMVLGEYRRQVAGLLEHFGDHEIVPTDPYDVSTEWADRWIAYDADTELTPEQRSTFAAAKEESHEGGPCCCKCWRYYAYSGVAKHMLVEQGVTAERIARLWDLSNGCGGHGH